MKNFWEKKIFGQKAKDFAKGVATSAFEAGSRLWQSIPQSGEIVSNRTALLTNWPKMQNWCQKYSEQISNVREKDETNVRKKDKTNANQDIDI